MRHVLMETTETVNCDVCSLTFTSKLEYFEHQLTLLHHKKLEEKTKWTKHNCQLCKQEFHNLLLYTQHIDSERHRQKLQENRRASSSNVESENIWYHTRPGFTNILSRSFSALKNTAKRRPSLIEPLMFPSDAVPKKRRGSKSLEEKQILTPPPDDSRLQSAHHTSTHSTVTSTCSLPRTSNQQSIAPISSYNISTASSFTEDVAVANFKEQEGSYFNPNDTTHQNIPFSRPSSHMTNLPDFIPLDNEPDLCSPSKAMTRRPIHQRNPPFSKDSRLIPDAVYQYKVGGKKVFQKGKFPHPKFEAVWHDRTDTAQNVGKEDDRGHVSQRKIGDTKKMSRDRVHHFGREQNKLGENTDGKKKGGMASSKRTETEMSIKSLKEKRHDELEKKLEQLRKNPRKYKPKPRAILEGKICLIPPGNTDKTLRKIPVDSVKQRKDGPGVGTNQSAVKEVVKTDHSNDQSRLIKNNSIGGQNEIKQIGSTSQIIDHTSPTTSGISVNPSSLQTEKKIDKMVKRREDFVVIPSTPSPPAGKITSNISPTSKLDKNSELHVEKTSKDRQANKPVLSKTTTPQTSGSLNKSLTTSTPVPTVVAMDTSSLEEGHSSSKKSSLLTDSCLTSSKSNDFVSQAVNSLITTHVYDMMHGRLKLNEMGGSDLTSMNTKQIKRPNQIENPDDVDISAAKRRKIGDPKSTPVVLPEPQSPVRTTTNTSTGTQTVMTKTAGPSVVSKTPTPLIVPKPQPPVRTTTNTSTGNQTVTTKTAGPSVVSKTPTPLIVPKSQPPVQTTSNTSTGNQVVATKTAGPSVVSKTPTPLIVPQPQSPVQTTNTSTGNQTVMTKTAGPSVVSKTPTPLIVPKPPSTVQTTSNTSTGNQTVMTKTTGPSVVSKTPTPLIVPKSQPPVRTTTNTSTGNQTVMTKTTGPSVVSKTPTPLIVPKSQPPVRTTTNTSTGNQTVMTKTTGPSVVSKTPTPLIVPQPQSPVRTTNTSTGNHSVMTKTTGPSVVSKTPTPLIVPKSQPPVRTTTNTSTGNQTVMTKTTGPSVVSKTPTPLIVPQPQSPVQTTNTSTGNQTVMTKTTGPSVVSKTPTPLIVPKSQPPVRTTTNTSTGNQTVMTKTAGPSVVSKTPTPLIVPQPQSPVRTTINSSTGNQTVMTKTAGPSVVSKTPTPLIVPQPQPPVRTTNTSTGNQTVMTKTAGPSVVSKTPTPLIVPKSQPPVQTATNTSSGIKTILTETAVVSQPQTTVQNTENISNITGVNQTVLSTSATLYVVVPPIVQKDQTVVTTTAGLFVFSKSHETVQNTTDTVKVQMDPVVEPQPQPMVPNPSTINISTDTQPTQQVSSALVVPSSESSRSNSQPGMQSTNSSLITTSSMTNKPVSSINEPVSLMTNEPVSSMTNEPVSSMTNEPVSSMTNEPVSSVVQVTNTLVQQIMEEAKELENLQNGQNSLKNSVTKTSNSKSRNRIESTDGGKKVSKSVRNTSERLKSPTSATKAKPSKPITHSVTKHRKTKVLESSKEDSLSMETMETKSTDDGCHGNPSQKKRSSNQPISTLPSKMKSDGKDLMMVMEKVKIKQEPWSPSTLNACSSPMNANSPYTLNFSPLPLDSSLKEDLDSVPSPNQMSPQSKCCFRHQDGSHCGQFVNEGDRLCTEHKKVPEQLKAILGLSPPKRFPCDIENIRSLNETASFIQTETPCDQKEDNSPLPFEEPMEVTPTDLPDVTPPCSPPLAIKKVTPASFKIELASLNKKEEEVQVALVDTESQLSDVSTELTELEERLYHLSSFKNELIDKCEKLTRQYQQVLSEKQTLLHTKYVTKYIPSLVKKTELTPKDTCLQTPGMDSLISKTDTHTTPNDTHTTCTQTDTHTIQTDTHTTQTDNHTTPPNDTHTIQTDTHTTTTDAHTTQTGVRPVSSSRHTIPEPCLLPDPHIPQTDAHTTQTGVRPVSSSRHTTPEPCLLPDPHIPQTDTHTTQTGVRPVSSSRHTTPEPCLLPDPRIPQTETQMSLQTTLNSSFQTNPQSQDMHTRTDSKSSIPTSSSSIDKGTVERSKDKHVLTSEKYGRQSKHPVRTENESTNGIEAKDSNIKITSQMNKPENSSEKRINDEKPSSESKRSKREDNKTQTGTITETVRNESQGTTYDEVFFEPQCDDINSSNQTDPISRVSVVPNFDSHDNSVVSMKVYGNELYTSSSDKTTRAYNIQTGEVIRRFTDHQKSVTCLELYHNQEGTFILSGSSDRLINMYNVKNGRLVAKFKCGTRVMYLAVCGFLLFIAQHSGSIAIINLELKRLVGKQVCHESNKPVSCVAVTESLLFTAAYDYTIACWDVKDLMSTGRLSKYCKKIKELSTFHNTVLCLKVHNDLLFCGSADKTVQIFDIKTWERVHCLTCHSGAVSAIEIMGKVLITACFDKMIRCFDLERLQLLQVYGGHTDMIFSLAAHNGVIYSGSRHGSVQGFILDLTKFHECKWRACGLHFGILDHLREHIKVHRTVSLECKWEGCNELGPFSDWLLHVQKHILLEK